MADWRTRAAAILDLGHQRALFRPAIVRAVFILASVVAICAQQHSFFALTKDPDPYYRNVLNLGASYQRFFSFFYYFGGFPVNLDRQPSRTREETVATLTLLGARLTPESGIYNRASIFIFYPDAYLKGRPDTAEMRTGHALWFTFGLLAIFGALTYAGMPLLGLLVAVLCGSDPFQVYELYHVSSSTIFPTVISTGLVVAAACILLSTDRFARSPARSYLVTALCGVIGALQYEIRLEGVGIFLGAAFSLVACFSHSRMMKLRLALVFAVAAWTSNAAIDWFFNAAFNRANTVVVSYGGTAAPAGNPYYATQWWALWSGLGDFDEKYGFLADDRAGISYYYGHGLATISETAHRNNFIEVATGDPGWFADVLFRRLRRVLIENTPYRLGYGDAFVDVPVPRAAVTLAGLLLLVGGTLASVRDSAARRRLNLIVLPLSVGAVAVGQLADYGLQFYSIAHLFLVSYVACVGLDALVWAMRTIAGKAAN